MPTEGLEKQAAVPNLRDDLRREALQRLNAVVPGVDSRNFEHASIAVGAFLARTLASADLLEEELRRDDRLAANAEGKLPVNHRRLYEDFITEAESLAIILPALMQQARLVQNTPAVQIRLQQIYDAISLRDRALSQIEQVRAVLLKADGSRLQGRPIRLPDEDIRRLVAIADEAWRIRERLTAPADLEQMQKTLAGAEGQVKRLTENIGSTTRVLNGVSESLRRSNGAIRVEQGFPGAEIILDNPDISMDVWRRLLERGSPAQRRRYARQLRESVQQFRTDFLDRRLLQDFEKFARQKLQEYIKANRQGAPAAIASWCRTFGMDAVADRLTNSPETFERVFEEVVAKVRGEFEDIAKHEAGRTQVFIATLQRIETAGELDAPVLARGIDAYRDIQRNAAQTTAAVHRWMVSENVGVIGNPVDGRATMVEQITRVGDQTLVGFLRNQSPYGIFRPRSYYDPRTNRLVLVTPIQNGEGGFIDQAAYHGREIGKTVLVGVPTFLALRAILQRMPLLSRVPGLNTFLARVGLPVAAGYSLSVATEALAQQHRFRLALQDVDQVVRALDNPQQPLTQNQLTAAANVLFAQFVLLLHTARPDTSPDRPDPVLALEAHLYVNQFMVALGHPPCHQLGPIPAGLTLNDVPADRRSPEILQYFQVRTADADARRKENWEQQSKKFELQNHMHESLRKLGIEVRQTQDLTQALVRGEQLRFPDVARLMQATQTPEFAQIREATLMHFGPPGSPERRENIFRLIGDIHFAGRCIRKIHDEHRRDTLGLSQNEQTPERRREILLKRNRSYSLDGVSFTLASVEQDIVRLLYQTPLTDVLAASTFFQETANQPTEEELSQYWYRTSIPGRFLGGNSVREYLRQRHGNDGQRSGVGHDAVRVLLGDLSEYAGMFLRNEAQARPDYAADRVIGSLVIRQWVQQLNARVPAAQQLTVREVRSVPSADNSRRETVPTLSSGGVSSIVVENGDRQLYFFVSGGRWYWSSQGSPAWRPITEASYSEEQTKANPVLGHFNDLAVHLGQRFPRLRSAPHARASQIWKQASETVMQRGAQFSPRRVIIADNIEGIELSQGNDRVVFYSLGGWLRWDTPDYPEPAWILGSRFRINMTPFRTAMNTLADELMRLE